MRKVLLLLSLLMFCAGQALADWPAASQSGFMNTCVSKCQPVAASKKLPANFCQSHCRCSLLGTMRVVSYEDLLQIDRAARMNQPVNPAILKRVQNVAAQCATR